MKKFVIAGICSVGMLAACASPDLGMKLEKGGQETILMGSLLDAQSKTKANFMATDGKLTCEGNTKSGSTKTLWTKYKISLLFDVSCSNGTTGTVAFQGTHDGMDTYIGAGSGTLSDGTKVKIVVGDAVLMAL
jgi:hypothetical protein